MKRKKRDLVFVVVRNPHRGVDRLLAEGTLGAVGKPRIHAVLVEGMETIEHLQRVERLVVVREGGGMGEQKCKGVEGVKA